MLWSSPLSYRGLSGLATTSFAFLAARLLREQIVARNRWGTAILASLIAGLALKIGYEFWSGQCILVSAAGTFTPQPLSHVLGALVGCVMGILRIGTLGSLVFRGRETAGTTADLTPTR
jgi:hypothetical protein